VDIVGHLDTDIHEAGTEISGSKVIGTVDETSTILESHVIDEVVIAIPRTMLSDAQRLENPYKNHPGSIER